MLRKRSHHALLNGKRQRLHSKCSFGDLRPSKQNSENKKPHHGHSAIKKQVAEKATSEDKDAH